MRRRPRRAAQAHCAPALPGSSSWRDAPGPGTAPPAAAPRPRPALRWGGRQPGRLSSGAAEVPAGAVRGDSAILGPSLSGIRRRPALGFPLAAAGPAKGCEVTATRLRRSPRPGGVLLRPRPGPGRAPGKMAAAQGRWAGPEPCRAAKPSSAPGGTRSRPAGWGWVFSRLTTFLIGFTLCLFTVSCAVPGENLTSR